ncbi:oligoendopeptidase F [Virgibacillus sp. 179-BFC.A HS]|uniref:Oligopeptidase F n=1 Tax=Tigheibacillus jepli TaxID=3035914 RepID=A0ABU5CJ16_9BACI|nr:oligoendopeptidase F [Virgibacillus sp. 179-BFC.A HS]MDY0406220.1 oligoendopeptidase F [Virgibacillus sp. 179-BFC.A HS]
MKCMSTTRPKRSEIPKEQTWDLSALFSSHDEWEKELSAVTTDVDQITSFKGKLTKNAKTLKEGLTALETYQNRLILVATYANLRSSADGSDAANQRDSARVASAMATIGAKLSFVKNELLTLNSEQIDAYQKEEPALMAFDKMLSDTMEDKPYTLSPELEEAFAALSEVLDAPYMIYERSKSSDMQFADIVDEAGNTQPMSAALYEDRYEFTADTVARRAAYDSFVRTLEQYKNTYAANYATEVNKQVTMSKLRGYDSVTDMLLHPQQVTKDMYHNQLDIIQKELAEHMRRFSKLKKEKLGLSEMRYCDLKAPLDPEYNPKTTFEDAKEIIQDALRVMGDEYSDIIHKGLSERWVDRADNIGKATGAFCSSPYGAHPYVLITWTDTMRGAFVLAHELGHAGHFYLAGKNQNLMNTRASTYFIEAPSTMNELLLANHMMKTDDKQKKRWVISQLLGTYYHNFVTHLLEGAFQRRVYDLAENGTPLTSDVLCSEKLAVLKSFWGDAVEVDEGAGLTWMRQPHYYMGLYPYTYSAGLTVSTLVSQMIQEEGQPAVDRWLEVLKAGGTLKPLDLIKKAGIDMSDPENIRKAVAFVGSLVDELEASYD